jgi:hypothetical protein
MFILGISSIVFVIVIVILVMAVCVVFEAYPANIVISDLLCGIPMGRKAVRSYRY